MSFARLALRMAAVEVLRGMPIVGPHVFDSRQDLIDGLDAAEARPLLAVYTEEDTTKPFGSGRIWPADPIAHVVIEVILAIEGVVEVTGVNGEDESYTAAGTPLTDRDHEALVDATCGLILQRLDPKQPTSVLFWGVATEIHELHTMPQRLPDKAGRLAARTMRFIVRHRADQWPDPGSDAATGFDALPEPLRTVAKGVPTDSDSSAILIKLAGLVAPPAAQTALAEVDLYSRHTTAPTTPSEAELHGRVTF